MDDLEAKISWEAGRLF